MNTSELPVVELGGTPLQRGRQYGEECRSSINECVRRWLDLLGEARGLNPLLYLHSFIEQTHYVKACERHAPSLMDELRGLSEGARLSWVEAFAFQVQDEEWVHARNRRLRIGRGEAERCSSIGCKDSVNGGSLLGQNMDIGRWCDGFQVLLHHRGRDGMPSSLILSIAGGLGLCGLNSAALGVCCNTLMQLDFSTSGLPVTFVVRRFLEHADFSAAAAFLRQIPHASGQNYLIGSPDNVHSLECSARSVVDHVPVPGLPRRIHTNHALANDDQAFARLNFAGEAIEQISGSPTSIARYESLRARFADPARAVTLADVFAGLAAKDDPARPVCRDGQSGTPGTPDEHIGFTIASVVYELRSPPTLHIAAGPPSETFYRTVSFDEMGASAGQ